MMVLKQSPNGNDPLLTVELLTILRSTSLFGTKAIVKDLSFEVFPGSITGLIGTNGSGKTTILNAVAQLIPVHQGSVVFNYATTGFMLETFPAPAFLTPRSWLKTVAQLHNLTAPAELITHTLARLNLTQYADAPIGTLSKGTAKRLQAAQAILYNPMLLIVDEPFSGLDAPSTELLIQLFTDYKQAGKAVIITGHTPEPWYDQIITLVHR